MKLMACGGSEIEIEIELVALPFNKRYPEGTKEIRKGNIVHLC